MIKAVSQLISEEVGIGSSQFQHSLTIINTYAISDKDMQVMFQHFHSNQCSVARIQAN